MTTFTDLGISTPDIASAAMVRVVYEVITSLVALAISLRTAEQAFPRKTDFVRPTHAVTGSAVVPVRTRSKVLAVPVLVTVGPSCRARPIIIALGVDTITSGTYPPAGPAVEIISLKIFTHAFTKCFTGQTGFPCTFPFDAVCPFCTMVPTSPAIVPVCIGICPLAVFADGLTFPVVATGFIDCSIPATSVSTGSTVEYVGC